MGGTDIKHLGSFVWSIAETLRGDFKQSEYGKVIYCSSSCCVVAPTQEFRHASGTPHKTRW